MYIRIIQSTLPVEDTGSPCEVSWWSQVSSSSHSWISWILHDHGWVVVSSLKSTYLHTHTQSLDGDLNFVAFSKIVIVPSNLCYWSCMHWTRDHTFPSQDDGVLQEHFMSVFAELSLVGHNTMILFLDKFGPFWLRLSSSLFVPSFTLFATCFVGPCPDRYYGIGSNFWKFYLVKTSFTLGWTGVFWWKCLDDLDWNGFYSHLIYWQGQRVCDALFNEVCKGFILLPLFNEVCKGFILLLIRLRPTLDEGPGNQFPRNQFGLIWSRLNPWVGAYLGP
jgi:hypothetical protein